MDDNGKIRKLKSYKMNLYLIYGEVQYQLLFYSASQTKMRKKKIKYMKTTSNRKLYASIIYFTHISV